MPPTHEAQQHLRERYHVEVEDFTPRVFWRLAPDWLEMTVRFITREHGVREVKDAMSREVIAGLDAAGIGLSSGTYNVVGFPPIRVEGVALDGR